MAGIRFFTRRIRRLSSSPAAKIASTCLFLILGFRLVIHYSHDDEWVPHAARPTTRVDSKRINWSKLYYVQHVTSPEYLCNALMIWSQIEEIGSRAQRLMLYPSHWDPNEVDQSDELTPIARLLQTAMNAYYVKLQPVDELHQNNPERKTWTGSYTKLLAFNLTDFDRVLALDTASVVRQNLDEIFLLPAGPVAMPYLYFGEPSGHKFSSQMMLITPSAKEFSRVKSAIKEAKKDENDMDIIKKLYKGKIVRIPQRPWNLLSGEFRRHNHAEYLGSRSTKWDPDLALQEAKFLYFSDGPIPKPWIRAPKDLLNKLMPRCSQSEWFGASDCRDRTVWLNLYYDFAEKRKAVCGTGFELQS